MDPGPAPSANSDATLAVKVTLDGAQQATQQLDALGQKGEQTASKFTAAFAQSTASAQQAATNMTAFQRQVASMSDAQRAAIERLNGVTVQQLGVTQAMIDAMRAETAATTENITATAAATEAHGAAAAATDLHGLALGRLRMGLTSAVAQMEGVPPILARISSTIGVMGVGMLPVIAALGTIAAGAVIWKAWHEEASKAADEQSRLAEELRKWNEAQRDNGTGKLTDQIKAASAELVTLRQRLDDIAGSKFFTTMGTVGEGGSKWLAWLRVLTGGDINGMVAQLGREMIKGTAHITQQTKDDGAAIAAAEEEKAKKINEAAIKAQKDRLDVIMQVSQSIIDAGNTAMSAEVNAFAKQLDLYRQQYKEKIRDFAVEVTQFSAAQFQGLARETAAAFIIPSATVSGKSIADLLQNTPAQQKAIDSLHDTLQKELVAGLEDAATRGLKSWTTFFSEVERMTRRMSDSIQESMKHLSGADAANAYDELQKLKAINVAVTGVAGLTQAYDVGRSSGSYGAAGLGGAASGAAAGAAIGSIVPVVGAAIGAVIGGIAGLTAGLFGEAQHIKDLRHQFETDEQKYIDSLSVYGSNAAQTYAQIEKAFADLQAAAAAAKTSVSADAAAAKNAAEAQLRFNVVSDLARQLNALDGPAGAFANALDDINKKFAENVASATALGLGETGLAEAEKIRTESVRQLILAEADLANTTSQLMSRLFSITGGSALGGGIDFSALDRAIQDAHNLGQADLETSLRQEKTLDLQFNAYLDGLQQAKDAAAAQAAFQQAQQDLLKAQLATMQQSLQVQQSTVTSLQNVVDNLKKFQDSLAIGNLSALSPTQQLAAAKTQYQSVLAAALTGDQTAAGNLPGAAQSYLGLAQSYYASGPGYARIFGDVQSGVGAVQDQFGGQLDTQSQILSELQRQTTILQSSLDTQQQSANMQKVQALLDAATVSGNVNDAVAQIHTLFPGLAIGANASGRAYIANADFSDPTTYALNTNRNTPFSELPGALQSLITQRHLRWLTGFDADGNAITQQFARGGDFYGDVMRLGRAGELGGELVATGPARVHTAEQLGAPVVAAVNLLRAEISDMKRQLVAATKFAGEKARLN